MDLKNYGYNRERRQKRLTGKIPVTLLVDDVETANELIKLAKAANVPVVEQEDVFK